MNPQVLSSPHRCSVYVLTEIDTCRRHNIPIRHYLRSVLPGLGEFPANRVSELTPANWARGRS